MARVKSIHLYYIVIAAIISMTVPASCSMDAAGPLSDEGSKTVLVYMAAEDNGLDNSALSNISQMMEGWLPEYTSPGEAGNVLLVYYNVSGESPKLIRLYKDRFGDANAEVIREYEEHNSVSDSVLSSVLGYAATLFPANYNGLILWSHGSGWLPSGYYSNPSSYYAPGEVPRYILQASLPDPYASCVKSFGEQWGKEMDIRDLAGALPLKYDFILFDACLMGGIEVAYELKDKCYYMIASPAEVFAYGFPYSAIMEPIFNSHHMADGLDEVCRLYLDFYESRDLGATVSLVNTYALDALATVCRRIFSESRALIPELDMARLQPYFRGGRAWFYDFGDFISYIADDSLYSEFRRVLGVAVPAKYATDGFYVNNDGFDIIKFSGLSTYVPNPENEILAEYYKTLAWNMAVSMVE